ncbi:MAG: alpha/beta hydrolase [Leptolyngbyaceae cyanobacterium bins.59]|nr:alpha/beta hydrolase [Leptolyngbyaceae cyanobacterium bins.59]
MDTIDILGVPCSYKLTPAVPNAPALVFIHGWLLSHHYWQPLIERLRDDFQCLSYDLRGFGKSQLSLRSPTSIPSPESPDRPEEVQEWVGASSRSAIEWDSSESSPGRPKASLLLPQTHPSLPEEASPLELPCCNRTAKPLHEWEVTSNYTAAAYARDLGVLLDQLEIETVWLVGHSLGGSIALWGAAQLADRVRGVICLNAGGGIYLKEEFEKFRAAGQQLIKYRPSWLCRFPLLDLFFCRANVAQRLDRHWGKQRILDFVTADPEAALGTLLDSTTEEEVHQLPCLVSHLKQPVYFITGTQDTIMEPRYVRHLASFHASFGDCGENVIELDQCGHLSMLEQPDAVADHMRVLVQQHLTS